MGQAPKAGPSKRGRDPVAVLGLAVAVLSLITSTAVGIWAIGLQSRASTPQLSLLEADTNLYNSFPGATPVPDGVVPTGLPYSCSAIVRLWNPGGAPSAVDRVVGTASLHGDTAQVSGPPTGGFASGAAWGKLSRYFWDLGYEIGSADGGSQQIGMSVPAYGIAAFQVNVDFALALPPQAVIDQMSEEYQRSAADRAAFDARNEPIRISFAFSMPSSSPTTPAQWSCQHITKDALDAIPPLEPSPSP